MQLYQTLYHPTEDGNYKVTYPEVIHLKDSNIQLIKEVFLNARDTGNTMLALQAQRKIEETLQINSREDEPMAFLRVVLSDYNYITANL